MRPDDRLKVELMRATARLTVSHGDDLRFAGDDLPAPQRVRVPTRHGRVPVLLYRPAPGPLPVHADGTPVSVGGFSSGGGLAASVALQARDSGSFTPTLQVLGIPALDCPPNRATATSA